MVLGGIVGAAYFPLLVYHDLPEFELVGVLFSVIGGAAGGAMFGAILVLTLIVLIAVLRPTPRSHLPVSTIPFWKQPNYWKRTLRITVLWPLAGLFTWPVILEKCSPGGFDKVIDWILVVESMAAVSGLIMGAIGWAAFPAPWAESFQSHLRRSCLGAAVIAAASALFAGMQNDANSSGNVAAAIIGGYTGFLFAFFIFWISELPFPPLRVVLRTIWAVMVEKSKER
jgi:hypothetical protein